MSNGRDPVSFGVRKRPADFRISIHDQEVRNQAWATEEAGLIFATSIKTINFQDARSGNYQKNLTNRRGDMLFEAVTLHRRFPYSVLLGLFCFDKGAGVS